MSADAPSCSGSGGGGGKFPRRPHSRHNPYARPVGDHRWLPKVLDPALSIFSSVFHRGTNAIGSTHPREINHESNEVGNDQNSANPLLSEEQPDGVQAEETKNVDLDVDRLSEVENMLNQKSFSREEFNRLTELLQARTIDSSPRNKKGVAEPSTSKSIDPLNKIENASTIVSDDVIGNSQSLENNPKHGIGLNALEGEIASPTEIAKAYMQSRPSRPSLSLVRSSVLRGVSASPRSSLSKQKPIDGSVVATSVLRFSELLENNHATQGMDFPSDFYARNSRSHLASPDISLSASKLTLKRRSSVLDSDHGSLGPVRRTRKKPNLVTSWGEAIFSPSRGHPHTPSTSQLRDPTNFIRRSHLLYSGRCKNALTESVEDEDSIPSCLSFASVPPQASLMANKILQQFHNIVPSPKGKLPEQLSSGRDGPSSSLLIHKFKGGLLANAKKTSLKMLDLADSYKLVSDSDPSLKSLATPIVVHGRLENNEPVSFPGTKRASEAKNANGASSSTIEAQPSGSFSWQSISTSVEFIPENKPYILKETSERFLELEPENYCSKPSSSMVIIKETQNSIGESNTLSFKTIPSTEQMVPLSGPDCIKINGKEVQEGSAFSHTVSSQISCQLHSISLPSILQSDSVKQQSELPVFNFGSMDARSLTFSSTLAGFNDSHDGKFGTKSEWKSQALTSTSQMHMGSRNDGEESPLFSFGAHSATHPNNSVVKPTSFFASISNASNAASSSTSALETSVFLAGSTANSFSTQANSIFGLSSTPRKEGPISTLVKFDLQSPQLNNEPSDAKSIPTRFTYPSPSTSIFGSYASFNSATPFSSTSSDTAFAVTSMPVAPNSTSSDGNKMNATNEVEVEMVKSTLARLPSDSSFHSPVPTVESSSQSSVFQFGSQPSSALLQSTSQPPNATGFVTGGSFSIGSDARDDKSARRFVRVKRDRLRR